MPLGEGSTVMDIADLVATAANTLVAAAATDAWTAARQRFAPLFARSRPDPAVSRRLDATRGRLMAASADDVVRVRAELADQWAVRLRDLLDDAPGLAEILRVLVAEIQAELPADALASGYWVSAGRDISVRADRGSVAAGVIHGSVAPPGPQQPGPGSS